MSTTGKPPGGPSKPLLGLDDSDVDAWDSMFDALHGGPDTSGEMPAAAGALGGDAENEWGAREDATVAAVAPPAFQQQHRHGTSDGFDDFVPPASHGQQVPAGRTIRSEDFEPGRDLDLDDQMTLDGALDSAAELDQAEIALGGGAAPSAYDASTDLDEAETDFSDLGATSISALGAPLGRGETAPPVPDDEIDEPASKTRIMAPDESQKLRRPMLDEARNRTTTGRQPAADDDGVYTSASRPIHPAPAKDPIDDDSIAPPPSYSPPAERRTPAIVRRSMSMPTVQPPRDESRSTPPGGHDVSMFAEATRIENVDQLEARAQSTRHTTSTAPPIAVDEDAYDDIEIDAASGAPEAPLETAPASQPVRRTAHVVRRTDAPTRPPPLANDPRAGSGPVIEMQVDDDAPRAASPRVPVQASSEDDFSDVAAAVGATDDVLPPQEPSRLPPRRPQARPDSLGVDLELDDVADADEPAPRRPGEVDLDNTLAALEIVPRRPAPVVPGMVPLGPRPGSFDRAAPSVEPDIDAALDGLGLDDVAPPPVATRTTPPPAPGKKIDAAAIDRARADAANRPPALTDLYPRVKTPTSVPPLGQQQKFPAKVPATLVEPQGSTAPTEPPGRLRPPEPPRRPTGGRLATPFALEAAAAVAESDVEPQVDFDAAARRWREQDTPLASSVLDEACAATLLVYEREVATLDDSATTSALRIEAGRLCERLADLERARSHYDAALLADPRATGALRGLRRIARASGDLGEATRHLDTEIAVAGALERRPLGHYRVDLLMASGEQDLARVAVGEILDSAPSDIRALLAQLELAFVDGRADEFGSALEQIAQAVSDSELRAAVQSARGALAAHHNDLAGAMSWFAAAAESDPGALAARLGAVRHAAAQADAHAAASALVDVARQVEAGDPLTAAAAALRAQQWTALALGTGRSERVADVATQAATLATTCAPQDPLVARLAAETGGAAGAFAHWAACAVSPQERVYAAARAAELDPQRGAEAWSTVLELDPGDDYAAAMLRTAHVTNAAAQPPLDAGLGKEVEVDLAIAADPERERARLRAAYGMIAHGKLGSAIEVLQEGRAQRPQSLALAEALAEALAAAGKWTERAKLLGELAANPGDQLDREVAQLRSAMAWEEAVTAAIAAETIPDPSGEHGRDDVQQVTASALSAWESVLEHDRGRNPAAHAATIVLATRMGDREVLADVLARAQEAERSPWAAASLAFRRARLIGSDDPQRAETLVRDLTQAAGDDPRRAIALVMAAARAGQGAGQGNESLADAASALEERANQLAGAKDPSSGRLPDPAGGAHNTEVASLRLRAAQLALDAGDAQRATRLLAHVETALPHLGVIPDLLAAARRRAGDRPTAATTRRVEPQPGASTSDAFARIVRDGDLAALHGDGAAAIGLYQRALELHPGDPLATVPLVRIATELGDAAPITALALARLRAAEEAGDAAGKAAAYELLAQLDSELRSDPESAQVALESASQADPSRIDLMHRLERHYAMLGELGELMRLRRAELATLPPELVRDRGALLLDVAGLATRDNRPEVELADIYRSILDVDPRMRLALLHLESITRRSGYSPELARLEEGIAAYFEGDPRSQAAFWTRAGETFAEIDQIDLAVQRFGRAESALPGHVPALEGWRSAALKGQLWIDVAEAASRQAANELDDERRAYLHHFAGVALMDKALVGDQAMAAFRRALEAEPRHKDAFLRLRILLEEDANHDDLATLLAARLDVEDDPTARSELHRALAELHRNFLSDRETAKKHYRAILETDANDLRAHAAIADIAWEQGNWQEAADALMSRAKLESAPDVLKTLCFRLGLIYADRLVDVPMALKAFQRALTYQPDDENTLIRLADLATQVGEWKLALGACERLVKNETDPDRRVAHLHRVSRIFKHGFNDQKRAERALNLALDGSPTNDDALQQLVNFYREARDIISVRVHLNRVAGAMRARVTQNPMDGVAYRVIARAMSARASAGMAGSLPIARCAAELAEILGSAGEPEQKLTQESPRPDLSLLVKPEADEVLFPRGVQVELRQIFQLLGDRIAKHVGVDLRPYGVTRGDRLRAKDNPVAAVAQSIASAMGFGDLDVYVSNKQPWVMVAEPTSPVSLVIGSSVAGAGGDAIRFAAGGALKLAQSSLAIPARLPVDDLGILTGALLRLFQPEFPAAGPELEAATATQTQKLRRLIPTNLVNELRPFALAVDSQRFDHRQLARDLKIAGLRAGLVSSGSLLVGLRVLLAQASEAAELPAFLADPVAQALVAFALSEDHAAIAR